MLDRYVTTILLAAPTIPQPHSDFGDLDSYPGGEFDQDDLAEARRDFSQLATTCIDYAVSLECEHVLYDTVFPKLSALTKIQLDEGAYKFNLAERMFLVELNRQIDAGKVTVVSPKVLHLLVDFLLDGQHVSTSTGSSRGANLKAVESCILNLKVNTNDLAYLIRLVMGSGDGVPHSVGDGEWG